MLSPQLNDAIEYISCRKQTGYLFQNRRGYTPYMFATFVAGFRNARTAMLRLLITKQKIKWLAIIAALYTRVILHVRMRQS